MQCFMHNHIEFNVVLYISLNTGNKEKIWNQEWERSWKPNTLPHASMQLCVKTRGLLHSILFISSCWLFMRQHKKLISIHCLLVCMVSSTSSEQAAHLVMLSLTSEEKILAPKHKLSSSNIIGTYLCMHGSFCF